MANVFEQILLQQLNTRLAGNLVMLVNTGAFEQIQYTCLTRWAHLYFILSLPGFQWPQFCCST